MYMHINTCCAFLQGRRRCWQRRGSPALFLQRNNPGAGRAPCPGVQLSAPGAPPPAEQLAPAPWDGKRTGSWCHSEPRPAPRSHAIAMETENASSSVRLEDSGGTGPPAAHKKKGEHIVPSRKTLFRDRLFGLLKELALGEDPDSS